MSFDDAWAAGFFDGEGCIRTTWKAARRHTASLDAGNVNPDPIRKLHQLFGGRISTRDNGYGLFYTWTVAHRIDVKNTLYHLRPYLIVKAEQADIVLQFLDTPREAEYDLTNLDTRLRWLKTREAIQTTGKG